MYRRIARLIQVGIFAALPAGAAFAQATSNTGGNSGPTGMVRNTGGITDHVGGSGSDSAKGLAGTLPDAADTRTPAQTRANRIDEQTPSLPGDRVRPGEMGTATPDPDMRSTTVEKKTIKHKKSKRSSTAPMPASDVDRPSPADDRSDLQMNPDDSMSHKMDSKGDVGNKDLMNSDK